MHAFNLVRVPGIVGTLDSHASVVVDNSPSDAWEEQKSRTLTPAAGKSLDITRVSGDVACDNGAPSDPSVGHLGVTTQVGAGSESAVTELGSNSAPGGALECTLASYENVAANIFVRGERDQSITVRWKTKGTWQLPVAVCTRDNVVTGRSVRFVHRVFHRAMRGAF